MRLAEVVAKYVELSGGYGQAAPLAAFGLSREATQCIFGALDEDYHISRFLHFQNNAGDVYDINGFPQTHVSIDAEIQSIL